MCVSMHTVWATVHVRPVDNFVELVAGSFLPLYMGSGNPTQVTRLVWKVPLPAELTPWPVSYWNPSLDSLSRLAGQQAL